MQIRRFEQQKQVRKKLLELKKEKLGTKGYLKTNYRKTTEKTLN
jgi:hypothetical protein